MEYTIKCERQKQRAEERARLSLGASAATHAGMVRSVNEDAVLDRGDIGLWAVADGVGGAYAGDLASRHIIDSLGMIAAPATASGFLGDVRRSLEDANRHLRAEPNAGGEDRVIASTVVCLLFFGRRFCCVWAGDSRLYRLRAGTLEQITHDHSEVQLLLDYELISVAEARRHPRANVITRAVGAEDVLQLDAVDGTIEPGDAFLLCSDGLTKLVEDSEIGASLARFSAADAVCHLIQTTLDRGAPDNVSVAAIKIAPGPNG